MAAGATAPVVGTLAEAFAPDPLLRHAFGTGAAPVPARLVARLFAPLVGACARAGGVVAAAQGAAAWLPAERWPPGPGLALRAGFLGLAARLPPAALWRLARHEGGCLGPLREAAPGAAYLVLIGVLPGARGRGLGRALLEGALAAMAGRFRRCLLKTECAESLAFYLRCGFAPRARLQPRGGLPVWVLERPLAP